MIIVYYIFINTNCWQVCYKIGDVEEKYPFPDEKSAVQAYLMIRGIFKCLGFELVKDMVNRGSGKTSLFSKK